MKIQRFAVILISLHLSLAGRRTQHNLSFFIFLVLYSPIMRRRWRWHNSIAVRHCTSVSVCDVSLLTIALWLAPIKMAKLVRNYVDRIHKIKNCLLVEQTIPKVNALIGHVKTSVEFTLNVCQIL